MSDQLPVVRFRRGWIRIRLDGSWQASDRGTEPFAKIATMLSRPPLYRYSPSHGSFGAEIAARVAKLFRAELIMPKAAASDDEPPEGVVF